MTNEAGLQFDENIQCDITKEEALQTLEWISAHVLQDHGIGHFCQYYEEHLIKLKKYIEERP